MIKRITFQKCMRFSSEYEKVNFCKFLEKCVKKQFLIVLARKSKFFQPRFQSLQSDNSKLFEQIIQSINCIDIPDGCIILLSNKYQEVKALKAIEFGSEITGLPNHIFHKIFTHIDDNLLLYYDKYIGRI